MDFGLVGYGWVGSDTTLNNSSDPDTIKRKQCYGSEFMKQERSCISEDDMLKSSKMLKTEPLLVQERNSCSLKANTTLFSDGPQRSMLSFSCPPKSEGILLDKSRNTGYSYESFNGVRMHGSLADVRWPFTASQWMELEHQALIYKYIKANVPIPTTLLIPIKRALESASFSTFSGEFLRPNALGWGALHLGFSSSNDPEPGRCRRTDGKKWRCSRDAVANQKYCERHMNRGRHRSRKPVEGRPGHSAVTTSKPVPDSTAISSVVLGSCGGGETNNLTVSQQHQQLNLQAVSSSCNVTAATTSINSGRMFYSKQNLGEKTEEPPALSMSSFNMLSNHETVTQSCFRQFMDDWPKTHSELDIPSARTLLADFMSSTSSPNHEKATLSPLRLSREFDPIQMGLRVGNIASESNQRQANWIPISWETSIGGPLGEVLNSTNNSASESKNSSALNLMTESPTGVLQKATFASVSSSSAGSSPRVEQSKVNKGAAT